MLLGYFVLNRRGKMSNFLFPSVSDSFNESRGVDIHYFAPKLKSSRHNEESGQREITREDKGSFRYVVREW